MYKDFIYESPINATTPEGVISFQRYYYCLIVISTEQSEWRDLDCHLDQRGEISNLINLHLLT